LSRAANVGVFVAPHFFVARWAIPGEAPTSVERSCFLRSRHDGVSPGPSDAIQTEIQVGNVCDGERAGVAISWSSSHRIASSSDRCTSRDPPAVLALPRGPSDTVQNAIQVGNVCDRERAGVAISSSSSHRIASRAPPIKLQRLAYERLVSTQFPAETFWGILLKRLREVFGFPSEFIDTLVCSDIRSRLLKISRRHAFQVIRSGVGAWMTTHRLHMIPSPSMFIRMSR